MPRSICIIQGHPHATGGHLCHALAEAYAKGADSVGAHLSRIDVGRIAPAPLADPADFKTPPGEPILSAQRQVTEADHLVIVFPLWLGTMPAALKAFFEQLARAEFALSGAGGRWPERKLRGRSARIIVTMGMPATAYRLMFGAAGVRSLRNGILWMSGIAPIRTTYIGGVESLGATGVRNWLGAIEDMGAAQR
jgi:putative NADPH-quinone reductase